jgi:hypothetical protein
MICAVNSTEGREQCIRPVAQAVYKLAPSISLLGFAIIFFGKEFYCQGLNSYYKLEFLFYSPAAESLFFQLLCMGIELRALAPSSRLPSSINVFQPKILAVIPVHPPPSFQASSKFDTTQSRCSSNAPTTPTTAHIGRK